MIPIPTLIIGIAIEWPIAYQSVGRDIGWDLREEGCGG